MFVDNFLVLLMLLKMIWFIIICLEDIVLNLLVWFISFVL